jgi:hypothetical protein
MADSLFDQEDNNTDYLQELTKPGAKFDRSKYATEAEMYQAIAKGKYLGDRTIEMQNQRFDELREDFLVERSENTAKDSFEQLRETLLNRKPEQKSDNTNKDLPSSLSREEALSLFQQQFNELKKKEAEESNLRQAETLLKQRFGDDAKKVFREKMNTLELSDEDVKFLARKSPQALINALGLSNDQTEHYEAPPRSSLRSDNFKPKVEIRDAVYYEKLRQEKPKEYFSEKVSVQRLKDMDDPDFLSRIQERDRRANF